MDTRVDRIDGIAGILAGPANVVMQLSWPPVAYGVLESKVQSGRLTEHPLKRFRTTFTYLAVATMASPRERQRFRRAVDGAHASVERPCRSGRRCGRSTAPPSGLTGRTAFNTYP